ncbi:CRISPR-associated protein Cas4 [Natrarchaeobius chitinivorans]|uniref:Dna2/Cas4 domain-containing protein n=1 Tax=Natrarchaeobius chitinivorans TaxID=1679083 RepID=A0A3N6M3T2_NATCH|nr:Dna2/Cas4 domain-containing protein [Natrarchaeobius chitinivorans]RQG95114.1 Dna2/Cas4 domain-containing protein [Natrarchaeobius chitinivorans]
MTRTHVSFSDLRTAAYCPRKCYYRRTAEEDDREPPPRVDAVRNLETRYEKLLEAPPGALAAEPIEVSPVCYREALSGTKRRLEDAGCWERLRNPRDRDVLATGRDCRGIVHKVLADPLEPVLVSTGKPPERGVWESQSVHAVAAAKALAWEHRTAIERAWLEYPAYGVIRSVKLTTRRKARYRRALRTVRELDGPPPRINNQSKCNSCEYAGTCGVRTRTLRSLLGFGGGG